MKVILPSESDGSTSSLLLRQVDGSGEDSVLGINDVEDMSAARLDSKLLAQHFAAKQRAGGGEATEPPLLTNAIRQLEKAKKQLVYSTCVVRIR